MSETGKSSESGFTLLELLVVIVLLGILSLLGAQAMPGDAGELERRAAIAERKLQQKWETALETSSTTFVSCDELTRATTPVVAADTPERAGAGRCMRAGRPSEGVRFYPDGSSSGETIELQVEDQSARITIDWLSGAITRE